MRLEPKLLSLLLIKFEMLLESNYKFNLVNIIWKETDLKVDRIRV